MNYNRILAVVYLSSSVVGLVVGATLIAVSIYFLNFGSEAEEWYFKVCSTESDGECEVLPFWLFKIIGMAALVLTFYMSKIGLRKWRL